MVVKILSHMYRETDVKFIWTTHKVNEELLPGSLILWIILILNTTSQFSHTSIFLCVCCVFEDQQTKIFTYLQFCSSLILSEKDQSRWLKIWLIIIFTILPPIFTHIFFSFRTLIKSSEQMTTQAIIHDWGPFRGFRDKG